MEKATAAQPENRECSIDTGTNVAVPNKSFSETSSRPVVGAQSGRGGAKEVQYRRGSWVRWFVLTLAAAAAAVAGFLVLSSI
jgi:hypothetical protein